MDTVRLGNQTHQVARWRLRLALATLATVTVLGWATSVRGDDDPFVWRWYEVDSQNRVQLNLHVFYRDNCPHCRDGLEFVERLRTSYSWLRVLKYETSRHAGNLELYRRMSASLKRRAGTVPAFFYCQQATIGFSSQATTGRTIESGLQRCQEHLQRQLDAQKSEASVGGGGLPTRWSGRGLAFARPAEAGLWVMSLLGSVDSQAADPAGPPDSARPEAGRQLAADQPILELPAPGLVEEADELVEVPLWGERHVSDLSLPTLTLILAGCDAFNPCAFFVLLSLLSLLIHARSRSRMLLVGGIFVLCSGLFYFLFMSAWLNVFLLAGHLPAITLVAGLLAVAVSLINIKDYFAFQRGVTLSIPERAKPGLFDRMRRLVAASAIWPMLLGTLALAAAANSYELLCTAGFPMVFTRALTLRELPTAAYYGYLGLYNVIYMIPLAVIVLGFTWTLGSHKLQQREGRILKLLSGVMMLLLGLIILLQPSLLQSVGTALLVLVGSLAVTALVVLLDGWRQHAAAG